MLIFLKKYKYNTWQGTSFLRTSKTCPTAVHRITEWFGLEGTIRSSGSNSPAKSRGIFQETRLLRAPSNLALNTAREGAATTPLGSLCQCFTTLMVKNFILISNLNLPPISLEPFPLVLSLHTLVKSPSPSFLLAPSGTGSCSKVTLEPALPQAEQPQLPQPVLVGEVLQPSDHLRGLLWPRSNTSMSFLCWGLQSWMQDSRCGLTTAELRGRIPSLALLSTLLLM